MKICIVTSPGGHLYQVMMLKEWWSTFDRVWISLNSTDVKTLLKQEKVFFAHGPENRDVFNFFRNFFLALSFLRKYKPDMVFSMGAGIAPPFFFWAKFFGIRTIYIEIYDFIEELSLSGKLIKPLADQFLVQHAELAKKIPKVKYRGSVI